MRYLMISDCGEGAGILYKLQQENNDVDLFIKNEMYRNTWDGILNKVTDPIDRVDPDSIILFDTIGFGDIADKLKSEGYKVFGASSFADKLESDREFGTDFMKSWGIQTPDVETFSDFKSSISFVKNSKWERFVFKPHGDHDEIPTSLTYCSDDKEDMLRYLEFVERRIKSVKDFDIQEFIEGVAISTEVYVSNGKPLGIYNHTIENKKFLNENLGPSTGCEGNLTWMCDEDILVKEGIGKVEDFEGHTGMIDLNCIVCEKGVYGLEWTPRFGYDATPTLLYSLLNCSTSEFFEKIISGELNSKDFNPEYASSVRLSIPPYPLEGKSPDYDNTGVPIDMDLNEEDIYFYEIMKDEDDELVHSGGIGLILISLGVSIDEEEAFENSYQNIENLKIPDMQFRTDLGNYICKDLDKFEDWSYHYA